MLTAHCGMPKRKLTVPSSGSTTQRMPARARRVAALLAQHAVVGPRGGDALADQVLGGVVGLGDQVGRACSWRSSAASGPRNASRSSAPASRATDSASARSSPVRHAATAGRCAAQLAGLLELGGEREQPRLGVGRADELDGEREAVGA